MLVPGRLILTLLVCALWSGAARAGNCLSHPEPFQLANDSVNWEFSLGPGLDCIQGLRYSAMLIDRVFVAGPPKAGRTVISGPSFRYYASPDFHGTDSFTLLITGSKHQVHGNSSIYVEIKLP
jgi:hypothetical protein